MTPSSQELESPGNPGRFSLSETTNPEGEEFEDERILETMRQSRSRPSRDLVARLVTGVRVFAAEAGLADDLTLMVVQRN